jgi:SAM-dependent methyltransferase
MEANAVYARPQDISSIDDCYFYHTMEIPGHGLVQGEWDLRKDVAQYLGGIDFRGKRVLEVGTASGFLCFEMERAGAEIVGYDLSNEYAWDIVLFTRFGNQALQEHIERRKAHIDKLNNGWWFAHKANRSRAKVVYRSVYAVPKEIGDVDVTTFCSILLHVREPFLALYNGLARTREKVLVTEKVRGKRWLLEATPWLGLPDMAFLQQHATCEPMETWWNLSHDVLGKDDSTKFLDLNTGRHKELLFTAVDKALPRSTKPTTSGTFRIPGNDRVPGRRSNFRSAC